MDQEKASQARQIVERLLKLSAERRREEARKLCGDDAELRTLVNSLWRETLADKLAATPAATPGSASAADPIAPKIPGYEIAGRLGQGAMGIVWEAVQLSTRRRVAIKLLSEASFGSERRRNRFVREVELAASLDHPNIARVYESGLDKGVYYYAMELVKGLPLDKFAKREKLNEIQCLELIRRVCVGIQSAHERGIVHRDLKPSNILVDKQGQPHILDFGLAKLLDGEGTIAMSVDGDVTGTPMFMSPEQAAGDVDRIDARTDVYALGVIAYRLLTGSSPHDLTGSYLQVIRRVAEEEVRRPELVGAKLDAEVEAILLKALSHDAARRYATAGELGDDIGRYLQGDPVAARPASFTYLATKRLRKHRWAVVTALVVGVVVLATGLVAYWLGGAGRHQEQAMASPQTAPADAPATQKTVEPPQATTQPEPPSPPVAAVTTSAPAAPPAMQAASEVDQGLLVHYSFDSAADPVGTVRDESPAGNDGNVQGPIWTNLGHGHGAYVFTAANKTDVITADKGVNPEQITLCAWINTGSTGDGWRRIIDKGYALAIGGDWQGLVTSSRGKAELQIDDDHSVTSDTGVADGAWHHVAATYDGLDMIMYIDGRAQTFDLKWQGAVIGSGSGLRIGNSFEGKNPGSRDNDQAFDGEIRQVRVYGRALSAAEIMAVMKADSLPADEGAALQPQPDVQEGTKWTLPPAEKSPEVPVAAREEPADLKSGLVLHFSFDFPAVDGVVTDESGRSNDGRVVGARWVTEGNRHGAYAFKFADQTDQIIVPDNPSLNPPQITLAAWIKTVDHDEYWNRIIDKDVYRGYCLSMGGDWKGKNIWRGRVGMESLISNRIAYSSTVVGDGRWHHVAATFDGTVVRLFIDGVQEQKDSEGKSLPVRAPGRLPASDSNLRIGNGFVRLGGKPNGTPEVLHFDGEIREVRIYNRPLSAAEIKALVEATR